LDKLLKVPLAVLSVASVLALVACNGASSSFNPFVQQRGTVRFINASPDVGAVDFAIGAAGKPNFKAVPYAGTAGTGFGGDGGCSTGICTYTQFNAATQNVFLYAAGQDTTPIPVAHNLTSIAIPANQRVTVALVGEKANGTLALITFNETLFTTVQGAASAQFHNAAPSTAGTAWTYGGVNLPPSSSGNGLPTSGGVPFQPSLTYPTNTTSAVIGLPSPLTPTSGIAFYAYGGPASAAPQPPANALGIFPDQVDPSNAGNVMPFSAGPNSDQNLSIFVIDSLGSVGSSGPVTQKLVGVFDPDN
jgi:hypothetical protein